MATRISNAKIGVKRGSVACSSERTEQVIHERTKGSNKAELRFETRLAQTLG